MYWLGLDENEPPGTVAYPTKYRIADGLQTAALMGATVVRAHTVGISTGNPLSFEPALGVFNDSALDAADYAIHVAESVGIKLIVPLTDQYHYFHGGYHNFCDWLGVPESEFYTNPQVISAFQDYVRHRLTHVNPYTGRTALSEPAILAWETGNELQPPANWTGAIAAFIKSIDSNHLVLDGTYGINAEALPLPDVDLYSNHFYPVNAAVLAGNQQKVAAANKVLIVGEFGWTTGDVQGFLTQVESQPVTAACMYWSLFPHADNHGFVQHNDGFTMHWPGDNPAMATAAAMLRTFAFNMSGVTPPALPPPLQPLITSISTSGSGASVTLAWSGAAGGGTYVVQAAPSASGPWTVVDKGHTDNDTPVVVPVGPGDAWVQVTALNVNGVPGSPSPSVQVPADSQ